MSALRAARSAAASRLRRARVRLATVRLANERAAGLAALDGRLPAYAAGAVAAACAAVLTTSGAVAITRAHAGSTASRHGTGPAAGAAATAPPGGGPASSVSGAAGAGQGGPGASAGPGGGGSVTASPAPGAGASGGTTGGPATWLDPVDLLVPLDAVLRSYARVSDAVGGTGPIDLAKAAAIDSGRATPTDEDERTMRELGFVRGFSRAWDDGRSTAVLYVYEWTSAASARAFLGGVRAVHDERGDGWTPATPGSVGACRANASGDTDDTVVFAVGRYTFIAAVVRAGTCATHAQVLDVADAQYDYARAHGA